LESKDEDGQIVMRDGAAAVLHFAGLQRCDHVVGIIESAREQRVHARAIVRHPFCVERFRESVGKNDEPFTRCE
jgi:hypothetical protein